jgi:N-methylhydantoinase A
VLVTKGFEDILELGRTKMPDPFSLFTMRPVPLSRKNFIRGIVERIDAKGRIVTPLDEDSLLAGREGIAGAGRRHHLLRVHERVPESGARAAGARAACRSDARAPSSSCRPISGRRCASTSGPTVAVMNSYIAPKVKQYLGDLQQRQKSIGLRCPLYMTSSNGGIVPIGHAIARPINTLLSGPASGIVATLQLMRASGLTKVVSMDVGGTSADLCVLDGDEIPYAWDQEIDGLPVTCRASTYRRSAPAAARSRMRTTSGLLRVGRRAPARIRVRSRMDAAVQADADRCVPRQRLHRSG